MNHRKCSVHEVIIKSASLVRSIICLESRPKLHPAKFRRNGHRSRSDQSQLVVNESNRSICFN